MEPVETIALLSVISDFLFRMKQEFDHMTPEEFKAMLDAQQVKADALEDRLRREPE